MDMIIDLEANEDEESLLVVDMYSCNEFKIFKSVGHRLHLDRLLF
jgi:hypothetical protein